MKLAALLFTGGAALTVWGWRVVHTPLSPIAERAISAASGIDPSQISVGGARLGWMGVELSDVRVGPATAERIHVGLDRRRALVSAFALSARGARFEAAELAVELEHGRLHRAAFSGGRLGPLDQLAGVATREGDHFAVRAARPGLLISGRISNAQVDARAQLDRLPLAGLLPGGLDGARAQASGALELRGSEGLWSARVRLDVDDLAIDHHTAAGRRIEHLSPRFDGELAYSAGKLSSDQLRVTLGPLALALAGRLAPDGFDLSARVEPLACAEVLDALRPVLPSLDGLVVDGHFGGTVHAAGQPAQLAEMQLGFDLDVGCRVQTDAPLADVHALAGPVPFSARDASGKARTILLGPLNPTWKSLSLLPQPVVRAFVEAEDSRFFHHHGFDADMIRRALAHDLGAGRIDRGASTITQQLVKNLFLSGERTAARKLEEAVLAWRTEQLLDKRRILELYLNLVELAPGVYGLTEGAERYFGKEPEELSSDEGAQLAALLPAPRRGMDAAWEKRYQLLKARLPSAPRPTVQLTRR